MSTSQWTRTLIICATILLLAVMVIGAFWLLSFIGDIVLLLLLASLFTIVLMPLVDMLERTRRVPRPFAVLIAYLCVLIVFGALMYLIIPPLVQQSNQLVQNLPDIAASLMGPNSALNEALGRFGMSTDVSSGNIGSQLQTVAKTVLSNVAIILRDVGQVATGIVVVAVIAFYGLNEGHSFRARFYKLVPETRRESVVFLQESVVNAVGGYVRAQLAVAFMVGVLAGFSAWIIGVRFPLIIGALAGVFELIPFFGPVLGAIPALAIALFQGPLLRVILTLVAFIVIQQIESNLIGPRIMAHGVGLHPLAVIVAVLIGIQVAGVWGALFAVPGAAILAAIGRRVWLERMRPRRVGQAA